MARKYTHEEFVSKANTIHHNKFQYLDPYRGSRIKINIFCPNHGYFSQFPYSHLEGTGCKKCDIERRSQNNTLTHEQFVKKANKVHTNKYIYCEKYIHSQCLLSISCPIHGDFKQFPYTHLLGNGCKKCADEKRVGGYSLGWFDKFPDEKKTNSTLYVVKLTHRNYSFLKVGITINVKHRMQLYSLKNLDYDIIMQYNFPLYDSWEIEQQLISNLKPHRYYPNVQFSGYTECFKNTNKVLKHITETIYNLTRGKHYDTFNR